VSGNLCVAEEVIDRRTRIEQFRGREIEFATGRVVLHAWHCAGGALCGRHPEHLAPTGQPWDASYLPHLPRCQGCLARGLRPGLPPLGLGEDPPSWLTPASPASGVDVRAASGTAEELAGVTCLRRILAEHDLRRWMFTDLVMVDGSIRGGFSHPLTLSPGVLAGRPARALATFLHEQLHWLEGPGLDEATAEASRRWPDPPPPPAGGEDAPSTWLHLSVCALEFQSLSEIIGPASAVAEVRELTRYPWIYGQILEDSDWFARFLRRHGLHFPSQPPVPRRYCGAAWWTSR
jgi:hypothetical protein